ncbi:MAG: 1-deoxy-D-xylulose-5-phosphate reductoisomerase [Gammaproteobacteria bacterium]|nr:1-deoxy-D-xylulose-5-phosphate reductoisomerase [Gammaproteobacteria bacterium]
MKGVTILGSTGSIGESTLDVLSRHPDRYKVIALTANTDIDRLLEQCKQFQPEYLVVADSGAAEKMDVILRGSDQDVKLLSGVAGLEEVASLPQAEYVMAAIVGAAGLKPTLAAARSGKRILLANKESLVMSGHLLMEEVKKHHAELLPIDSEHNAIFQSMPVNFGKGLSKVGVRKILLTASGGPFRTTPLSQLDKVTPEQACAHPNWEMGKKISVDSATMMNKGLEVIEACWLFNTDPDRIQVVLHPQSVIHSMVEYVDGSVLAQLGNPDMRTPIAHALAWPERIESGVESLDIFSVARLDFEPPDYDRFPCLRLAYEAMHIGGTAPAILNAANEVAVQEFLEGRLAFTGISGLIEKTLKDVTPGTADSLETLYEADQQARLTAKGMVNAA